MTQRLASRSAGRLLHRHLHVEHLEDRRLLAMVTVTTEMDVVADDGLTSLREAISATNAMSGPDDIVFDFGHDDPATILLEEGELEITEAVTITGDGPDLLTIDAQQQSRIFNITAETGDFTIAGMTLTGGRTTGDNADFDDNTFSGGAVRSLTTGNLTIQSSAVTGNSITGNRTSGGGVFAAGDVTVTSSTVSGNSAVSGGGGIRANGDVTVTSSTISGNDGRGISGDTVTVTSSTISGNDGGGISGDTVTVTASEISGNSADFTGGGISGVTVTVTSSTISGNSVIGFFGRGGGVYGFGVTVTDSTISGNSAGRVGTGDGVWSDGPVRITNSIVAGNTDDDTAPDVQPNTGTLTVEHSLIGDNTGTGLTEAPVGSPDANGNLIGGPINGVIDPMLAPLANNGGPTQTHRLLPGSPAIDAGDPLAMAGAGDTPQFDQRGTPYTRVYDAGGGVRIDMGAFELQPQPGDLNGDLAVNFADLTPFALALTDPAAYEAMYPDLDRVFLCDVSGDRLCNFGDLQPFADLLVGGSAAVDGTGQGLATVPDVTPVMSKPSQRAVQRGPSSVVEPVRDRALVAWLSSFSEDDDDGDPESEPDRGEAGEVEGLPTGVMESVFQGMQD